MFNSKKELCVSEGTNITKINTSHKNGKVNLNDSLRNFSTQYTYPSKLEEQKWFIYLYDKKGKMIIGEFDWKEKNNE